MASCLKSFIPCFFRVKRLNNLAHLDSKKSLKLPKVG